MRAYLKIALDLSSHFRSFTIEQVPREKNSHADSLAGLGSSSPSSSRRSIPFDYLEKSSLSPTTTVEVKQVNQDEDMGFGHPDQWYEDIVTYIREGSLPDDKKEARKVVQKAARYSIISGCLYKRSYSGPYLKCVERAESIDILREIHGGECGNHTGGRSTAQKILRNGYYWPSLKRDSEDFVRRCERCQKHAPMVHMPTEQMSSVKSPWPFMKWGMDIVGPFPTAPAQKRYLLVMIDYYTKWITAEPYSTIKDRDVKGFVWKNIICQFGIPKEIATDNGSQFISQVFRKFCDEWKIKLCFSTPRYPQSNGLAESSNKTIINSLRKRLELAKGRWVEELPGVLWAYRTTPRTATGESPFSLVYGTEAVIPTELSIPTLRSEISEAENSVLLREAGDLIDERREQALIRIAWRQQQVERYFNTKVRPRQFKLGDLVLRRVFQNTQEMNSGKLGNNWEGPYKVTAIVKNGVYRLETLDEVEVPRSWNAFHLKKYYM